MASMSMIPSSMFRMPDEMLTGKILGLWYGKIGGAFHADSVKNVSAQASLPVMLTFFSFV